MVSIGETIDNRYNVKEHLGTGGMAEVFEAEDLITKRTVAIKILKEELKSDKNNLSLFNKEANASACMSHQNIMEIYNEGSYNGCPYLVIEYLKDQTLLDKLDYFTKFSVTEACQIMLQLLDAIDYTHKHGIIHRDIKPQNIFYMPNGTIKLGDFGIALNEKETGIPGNILGSVYYLAPEIFQGQKFSIQSDIYAAGVTLYQLVTGKTPYDGSTEEIASAHVKKPFPKASSVNQLIPHDIDSIILKACNKNPRARYKNAIEFKTAISNFLSGKKEKKSFLDRIFK